MRRNRSIPDCDAMAELPYSDIAAAIDWLRDAFGFTLRLRADVDPKTWGEIEG